MIKWIKKGKSAKYLELKREFDSKQAEVQQCLAQIFGSARATTIPIFCLVWPGLAYPDMA